MKRLFVPFAFIAIAFTSCSKDEGEDIPYPVWILNVTVRDAVNSSQPIQACARLVWSYSAGGVIHSENCYESNERLKAWDHIEDPVTINFRVECSGYNPSNDMSVNFYTDNIGQLPGREGQEVIENRTVYLYPN